MSKVKQLISLLDSLEKREFDVIVKTYLKKEYSYNSIVFTDGKDDTGIDIKVFDFDGEKVQYQLTTQKSSSKSELASFNKKILEDLEKAKINFQDYGFKDKLIFFYSKTLTNARIREYEKKAFKDFKINLEIIEANRLAEEAENIVEIQAELYRINELDKFKADSSQFDNSLFYDLLSFGKPTEFKTQVIDSFVLQHFYLKGNLKQEEIIEACQLHFSVKENDVFYERLLNRFQAERKIKKDKATNSYFLTEDERLLLKTQNDQFELDKNIFVRDITDLLSKYNQENEISQYINELKKLYIDNFNTDLSDLLRNETEFHISSIFTPFIKFIEQKLKNGSNAKALAIELLKYCLNNKFMQKVAATKVYSSKIDNRRLQNYINNKKKTFIDTSVGLYSLCYYYKPKSNYNNYFYKASKSLLEYSKLENSKLFISERYIWEIQNHIREAFRLLPFTSIKNFANLGASRNVFYNFYNFLIQSEEIIKSKTFLDFLSDFDFVETATKESFNSIIEYALSRVGIVKQVIEKDYSIYNANQLFENALSKFFKSKTSFARNCDSIMLEFLADNDLAIHPIEPIFLTWDKTFFEVHPRYIKMFPNSQNWLLLTPNKIVDIQALLKFSINSETVTENLLALISDDIIINTHSLVDTLAFILNPNDEVSLEYTSRLAQIREQEINRINNSELIPPENYEGEAVIDDIFFNLTNHYKDNVSQLKNFRAIFTKIELVDEVIRLLENTIKEFYQTKEISKKLYEEFDNLIAQTLKEKD